MFIIISIYSQSKFHQLSGYSKERERELWPNISYENIKHELIQQKNSTTTLDKKIVAYFFPLCFWFFYTLQDSSWHGHDAELDDDTILILTNA